MIVTFSHDIYDIDIDIIQSDIDSTIEYGVNDSVSIKNLDNNDASMQEMVRC